MTESYEDRVKRKFFAAPREEQPKVDTNLGWFEQINQALKPVDAKIRAGVAGAGRMLGPVIPYAASKADELASMAVGALQEPNNPMGRGDRPITPAWTPKTYTDIYKEGRERRKAEPEAAEAGRVISDMVRDYGILRGAGKAMPAGNILRSASPGGQVAQSAVTSPIAALIKEYNDAEDAAFDRGEPFNAYEGVKNIARNTVSSMTGGAIGGMSTRRFLPGGGLLKHAELNRNEKDTIRAADASNRNLPVNPRLHFGELAQQAGQTEVAAKANRAMRDARGVELTSQPSWVRSPQEWQDLINRYGNPPVVPAAMVDRLAERARPGGFNETTRTLDDRLTIAEDRLRRGTAGVPAVPAQPGPPPVAAVPGIPPMNIPLSGLTPPGVNPQRERQHQLALIEGRNATPPVPTAMTPGHSMDIWDRTTRGMPLQQRLEIETLLASVAPPRGRSNINVPGAINERAGVLRDAAPYQGARDAIRDAFPIQPPPASSVNISAPIAAAVTGKAPLAQIGFSRDRGKTASKIAPGMVDDPLRFMDQIGRAGPQQTLGNVVGQSVGRHPEFGGSALFETWIGLEDERRRREKLAR